MNGALRAPSPGRAVTPLVALAPALALVWWALPDGQSPWRAAAIVSAWAGTGLLVSSLLLMVREPRLARLLGGLEAAYRWHHRCGVLAYVLLLIHPLALAADAWVEAPGLAWQVLAPWKQSWPVGLGWLALVLLMGGLATTFAVHLSYRRWRGLHFGLGLGVLTGLGHIYVLLGNAAPLLVAIVFGVIALGWRFVVGDLGLATHPYRVTGIVSRAASMIEASLAPCASALTVTPGQFVLAAFGDGAHYHGCGEYHPFTVSGIGTDGSLRVSVKALGPCSQRLQTLEPGVLVRLQGPFGRFLESTGQGPQLWIAGGIGITPFIAALRASRCAYPTTLVYLHRDSADAAFADELDELAAADPQLELLALASGNEPADLDAVLSRIRDPAGREAHLCGPPPLVDALVPLLRRRGVRAIHFERFDFR